MRIGAGRPIQRHNLTGDAPRFFGCDGKGLHRSADFTLGIGDRLARLHGDRSGKLVSASINQRGDLLENVVSGMRRELPHGRSRTVGGCNGLVYIGLRRLGDLGDELSGERINDRGRGLAVLPLTVNQKRT